MTTFCQLPFPRGTFGCDGVVTPDGTCFSNLEGQVFSVPNDLHDDGTWVDLIVLRNDSGSTITLAQKFYKFSTGSQDFGRAIAGVNDAAGGLALPVDDNMAGKSWLANDYCYFILRGWGYATTEGSSVSLSAHDAIASDNAGCVNGAAAADGETVLGTIDQASTTTGDEVRCWFDIQLKKSEAAG